MQPEYSTCWFLKCWTPAMSVFFMKSMCLTCIWSIPGSLPDSHHLSHACLFLYLVNHHSLMLPSALVQSDCDILSYLQNSKVLTPFAQCLQVEIENEKIMHKQWLICLIFLCSVLITGQECDPTSHQLCPSIVILNAIGSLSRQCFWATNRIWKEAPCYASTVKWSLPDFETDCLFHTWLYICGSVETNVLRKSSHFWLLSVAQKHCVLKLPKAWFTLAIWRHNNTIITT